LHAVVFKNINPNIQFNLCKPSIPELHLRTILF
jgi:hypothetical protein